VSCHRCVDYNTPSSPIRYVRCLRCLGRGIMLDGSVCDAEGCSSGRVGMIRCPDCHPRVELNASCQTTGEIDPLAPLKLTPLLH
jgi:hypothetical protein